MNSLRLEKIQKNIQGEDNMIYKIDDKSINEYGAIPTNASGEKIALSGVFDLPKRIGTTEYDWGTSIEAFTDADDIELDGRTLTLNVTIKGTSLDDLHSKLSAFKAGCIACTKLWTEFGEFNVIQKDDITVEEYAFTKVATISVPFWQQDYVPVTISLIASGYGSYMLDSYNLIKDFGIYFNSYRDINNTPKRIDIDTTLPYTNTLYRSTRDMTIQCMMFGKSLADLSSKMSQFNALCIKSGSRLLTIPGNSARMVYFKDGISAKVESDKIISFDLKCRVIS